MEPHSLVGKTGEGGWSDWSLACGLQNQRLMARPPARTGGRSGLLTGRESGKPNGYSLPFPKGYPPTSPARPAGGRAVTGLLLGGPQARYFVRSTASPHTPTREGSPEGRTSSLWGSFPHFFPRNGAPAGQATVPRRSNGAGEKPQRPRPPHAKTPSLWPKNSHSAHGSYQVSYSLTAQTDKNLSFPIKLLSSACQ